MKKLQGGSEDFVTARKALLEPNHLNNCVKCTLSHKSCIFFTCDSQPSRAEQGTSRGLDILERSPWAATLFLMGPANALYLTEKLRKQDGGDGFAPSIPPLHLHYIQVSHHEPNLR